MRRDVESNPRWLTWMSGTLAGAIGMYFADPDRGRRRRALARDKLRHYSVATLRGADVATRDLYNHLQGYMARSVNRTLRRGFYSKADDPVITERVRAKLGRVVSHPHAIRVDVKQGKLCLTGQILASEKKACINAVSAIPGVSEVEDRLQAHKTADNVPSLQGGSGRTEIRSEFMQANWTPAVRGMAILGGTALGTLGSYYGLARRAPSAFMLSAVGLMMLMRGATNTPARRLLGAGSGRRAVDLQKTIEIAAPPEVVFDVWANFQNFPQFMSHVKEVRDLGDLRSHWIVHGPMGSRVEWNAVLTECIRPSVLAWATEPGAVVEHAGLIRLEPSENGTRASVRISYNPPAGALGHGIALLLGRDPKRQLDDDLMRMKSFIETGTMPRDAAARMTSAGHVLH